jgi:copper chaperone CopZ
MKSSLWNTLALVVGVIVVATVGPWLVSEVRSLPEHQALAARAGERVVTLDIGGMTCGGCAAKVRQELAATPGVSAVQVRLKQERAYVVCPSGVADSTLVAAVHRAGPGFAAAIVER